MDQRLSAVKKILIRLLEKEAENRRPGYLQECMESGLVAGKYIAIHPDRFAELRRKYKPWGDRLHDFLKPIAKWIDRKFGTRLATCSACNRRREGLNRWDAKFHRWLNSLTTRR